MTDKAGLPGAAWAAPGYILAAASLMASLGLVVFWVQPAWLELVWLRLAWLLLAAVPGGWLLRRAAARRPLPWEMAWAAAVALGAALYVALSNLPLITDYPLTLGWSETSRYYFASLFYARRIYGVALPTNVLDPTRDWLQSLAFLVPGGSLLWHRAWQSFLTLAIPAIFCAVLLRRLPPRPWAERWLVSAAIFLLLQAAGVYFHVLVCAIIVLWGFRASPQRPGSRGWWQNLLVLGLASAWAGASRVNWFPVPAMLAATLVLVETPLAAPNGTVRYLARLLGLGVYGAGVALATQAAYVFWSDNPASEFTTSLTSDLIWRRLLPSPTYPPGILPAAALISLPAGLILAARLVQGGWRRFHPLRLLGVAALLLALLGGGLLVSVKIGGGSNIHNLDGYLTVLAVLAVLFYYGRGPQEIASGALAGRLLAWGAVLSLLIPAGWCLVGRGVPQPLPERPLADATVQAIAQAAGQAAAQGGKSLFLTNRHLLTFGMLKGVALAPEYERVLLMEMAMANNQAALDRFHQQIRTHAWQVIVSEPLSMEKKDPDDSFGLENNLWVREVARYILCYYEPSVTVLPARVQIFVPRAVPRKVCP